MYGNVVVKSCILRTYYERNKLRPPFLEILSAWIPFNVQRSTALTGSANARMKRGLFRLQGPASRFLSLIS